MAAQRPVIAVKPSAAVAHQRAARRRRPELAERIDAIAQRTGGQRTRKIDRGEKAGAGAGEIGAGGTVSMSLTSASALASAATSTP